MKVAPLVGKQRQAVELATARINIADGAVRSSKTISTLLRWLQLVRTLPPGNLLMTGKTERTLRRNILDVLVEMLGPKRCRIVAGSGEMHLLGRKVYLAGANNELAVEKIRGLSLVGAYVDEVSLIPEAYWIMLLTRLSMPGATLLGSTNPDSEAHWLKVNYLDRARLWLDHNGHVHHSTDPDALNLHRMSFTLHDNPNLSPEYVDEVSREFAGLWYRRLILGEWCLAEGVVYESWDPARHVIPAVKVPRIDRWLCTAIDYGTTNPFHALLVGLGSDGRLYVTNEWRWDSRRTRAALTDAEYSHRLRAWIGELGVHPEWIIVDPSAASFSQQLLRDGRPSHPGDNAVLDGIRTVASLLATGRLLVSDACPELIKEIPAYAWDPKASLAGEDAPIKANDHGVDALRYGLHTTRELWLPHLTAPTPAPT